MKTALYCGSFNPFHIGHADLVSKAVEVFDNVIILVCHEDESISEARGQIIAETYKDVPFVGVATWNHSLASFLEANAGKINAVVRGLRNGTDLQYEKDLLYTYEDMGISIPFVYFMTSREFSHISGTMERAKAKYAES